MPDDDNRYRLYADEITGDDRPDLIHLNCGDESWARAATEWVLGTEVWDSIEKHGTRVWLYRNDKDVIVGFGSLGITRRRWPPPDGGYCNLLIVPMLGIDHRFHGQPPDREQRFSHQILSHLRFEAIQLFKSHQESGRSTLPLLSLYVHRENHRAIRLYERFGFLAKPAGVRADLLLMIQKLPTTTDQSQ